MNARPAKVLFLFNHDASHQAAHIAGIMSELAVTFPDIEVIAAVGSDKLEKAVRELAGDQAAEKIVWQRLDLPSWQNVLLALPNTVAPVKRLARLRRNEDLFESVDALVSTERTCLRVRRRLRAKNAANVPAFIYVPHGSGDRNVAYHPELRQYDYHLLSGQKLVDEMAAHDIASANQCRIIGYPKFDTLGVAEPVRLFDNDLPTIVYNPHFDPHLSSWYDSGPDILRRIAAVPDRFNCVFAPHVMLFRKKLHISPEYRKARLRPDIPQEALNASNVLIDVDGPRLFDMTYTRSADIYLGDVSSQVYEFLRDPGLAVFVDAAGQGTDAYQFWENGPVVTDAAGAMDALEDWRELAEQYRDTQKRLVAYTISPDPERSASQRGAEAIAGIVAQRKG